MKTGPNQLKTECHCSITAGSLVAGTNRYPVLVWQQRDIDSTWDMPPEKLVLAAHINKHMALKRIFMGIYG
jgi:hypothetical protein